jgi:hypothetical protein
VDNLTALRIVKRFFTKSGKKLQKNLWNVLRCTEQGDQIGPIFDYTAIVYFGKLFENERSPNFCTNIFNSRSYALIMTRDGLGYTLGDFFSKSHLVALALNDERIFRVPLLLRKQKRFAHLVNQL